MNDRQGFELHPGAAQDITDIWQFIAQDSVRAAARFRAEILNSIRKLAAFPHRGHNRPDLTSRPLRFQVIGNYLIAYASEEKPIVVIAIIHGRRNPRIMAAILRGRK